MKNMPMVRPWKSGRHHKVHQSSSDGNYEVQGFAEELPTWARSN